MSKRRSGGEGTAVYNEARDRWEGKFSYIDPDTGQAKRKTFTGKTQKIVMAKGQEFLNNIKNGLLPNADEITLSEWNDRWLEDYVKPTVRIKTYEKYESCLRYIKMSRLGNLPMAKIKSPDIQRVLNKLLTNGGRGGAGLSSGLVRDIRRYQGMAWKKAVEVGVARNNIVAMTKQPRLVKDEIHPLTKEQADKLLETARVGEYVFDDVKQCRKPTPSSEYHRSVSYMAVLLALETGMRRGEIFGLQWSSVDFAQNTIFVKKSLVSTATCGLLLEEPKTKAARRRILVTPNVIKALQKYKKEQAWFARLLGDKFNNESNLVFTNMWGKPLDISNWVTRFYKKMIKRAGLDEKFTFHDLRHTHATLLLASGINIKVISERLGHSTIAMTLDTYSHLMPDMQAEAVAALEQLLHIY